MATKVLRLDSSVFGDQGASTQLNDALVEQLQAKHGDLLITHRDLAAQPVPHFGAEVIGALSTQPERRTETQHTLVTLADRLINEVQAADILVIAAPMYNFTVPSTLKSWMDYVARAGVTFKYTNTGPMGLLGEKKVYVTSSRGGLHRGDPSDVVVPLLKNFFGLLGLIDIEVIYAEGLNMGNGQREKGLASAREQIKDVAA